jgi:ketosteroid isomerase-like protein
MSQENVEIVRAYYHAVERAFEAYWEDPRSAVEALKAGEVNPQGVEMFRYLHPNVEWKTPLMSITYRGYYGLSSGFDQLVEAAQAYGIKLKEVSDLGETDVLAVAEVEMQGRSSDIDLKTTVFAVVTVHDGLITQLSDYLQRHEALEAAGLSE